jgi:hypothetical protein
MRLLEMKAIIAELFNSSTFEDALLEKDNGVASDAKALETAEQMLYVYVDAELEGKDVETLFPEVHSAVQTYAELAQQYEDLKAILWAEQRENLKQPPIAADFDFSYLKTELPVTEAEQPIAATNSHGVRSQVATKPWWWDSVGRVIIAFSHELLQSLQSSPLQMAPVKSAASHSGSQLQYVVQGEEDDVHVEIAVRDARDHADCCDIAVSVEVPSRGGWPHLGGSQVILKRDDEWQETQSTDAFGKALFLEIAKADLPYLVFQITPIGRAAEGTEAAETT